MSVTNNAAAIAQQAQEFANYQAGTLDIQALTPANQAIMKMVVNALSVDSGTVNGRTVEIDVPADAKLTDTITEVSGELNSTDTARALSLAGAKQINDALQNVVNALDTLSVANIAGLQGNLDGKANINGSTPFTGNIRIGTAGAKRAVQFANDNNDGFPLEANSEGTDLLYGGIPILNPNGYRGVSDYTPEFFENITAGNTIFGDIQAIDASIGNILKGSFKFLPVPYTTIESDAEHKKPIGEMLIHDSPLENVVTIPAGVHEANTRITFYRKGTGLIKIDYESGVTGPYVESGERYSAFVLWFISATEVIPLGTFNEYEPDLVAKLPGLIARWPQSGLGTIGAATSTWVDVVGANNFVAPNAGDEPLVQDDGNGNKELVFDGNKALAIASNIPLFDFVPGTDEFTIVIHVGSVSSDNIYLAKGTFGGTSQYQYGILERSSTTHDAVVGGEVNSYALADPKNQIVVMSVSTTQVTTYVDGIQVDQSAFTGTFVTNAGQNGEQSVSLFSRHSGTSSKSTGNLKEVLILDRAAIASDLVALQTLKN